MPRHAEARAWAANAERYPRVKERVKKVVTNAGDLDGP